MAITNKEINAAFSSEVTNLPGGEHLNRCFSCGACSGICPVSQAIPEFDPRKIIHMIRMGLKDKILGSDLIWHCSKCRSCVFVCPQDVRFAEIMSAIREMALDQGYLNEQDLRDKGKVAWVERDLCVSCLTCVRICPWRIPAIDEKGVATIDARKCKGCGICPAECPAQAIRLNESEDARLIAACGTAQ
ncbi:MAG: 4Fe-4S dicluster domain-containing protein [Proteobacteria bacterium]|nr:4Fe-4S dicluster domain-containing protein [Pseudomonadota bacterium]MBU1686408.1 4Fe-4S dicluster domain-containing protein [Pseudomonadota bacterium]